MKKAYWIVPLVLVLVVIAYALIKAAQYSGEWKQFQSAWQEASRHISGTPGYSWQPGAIAAVGEMDFSESQLTSADLEKILPILRGVATLTTLRLSNSELTDVHLKALGEFDHLRELHLRNTQVTDAGVHDLQEILVDCRIVR